MVGVIFLLGLGLRLLSFILLLKINGRIRDKITLKLILEMSWSYWYC